MNIWEGLILFFGFQSIWIGVLILLTKKGDKRAKVVWFLFLLLFAYYIFYSVLYWSDFNSKLARRLSLVWMIPFSLYGPLYFFYIKMVVGKWNNNFLSISIHTAPLTAVLMVYGKYFALPLEYREMLVAKSEMKQYLIINPDYFQGVMSLILLGYGIGTIVYFRKHYKRNIKNANWIRTLNLLFIGFGLSWVIFYVLAFSELLTRGQDYIITGSMILFVLVQSYLVYKRPRVLINWEKTRQLARLFKYEKTGLSSEVSNEFKEKLLTIMAEDRPYLNPELKLDDLAGMVGLSRHHASQVINQHFNKGFFDFINEYRIRDAKKILLNRSGDGRGLTIEIVYMVGCNNKASFYKAFKKFVGTSPSHYIENELKIV